MDKVLIVVDVQNDFVDGVLGTKEAQSIIPKVVQKIKEFEGRRIFVTLDTHDEEYLKTKEGKYLPVEHCIKGTAGHELNGDVKLALEQAKNRVPVEYVIKTTFGTLKWKELLKDYNPAGLEIELIGICTSICVASNATIIKTLFPDATVRVDACCCACVTPESHKAGLEVMKLQQIEVYNE